MVKLSEVVPINESRTGEIVAPDSNVMLPVEDRVDDSPVAPLMTGRKTDVLSNTASLTWISPGDVNESDDPSVTERARLSEFRRAPVKAVPPDRDKVSFPPPKSTSPLIMPALAVKVSSPDPSNISPKIRGMLVAPSF